VAAVFRLEALEARHGDCLLLHHGDAGAPGLIVVDGGPSGVFRDVLRPRLEALREERGLDRPLPIDLLMVSHIDDDHIHGVLDLTRHLADLRKERKPAPWRIAGLWHNSFDDVVGDAAPLTGALEAAVRPVAMGGAPPAGLDRWSALVVASVQQGRDLRDDARALRLPVNQPWGPLVWAPAQGERTVTVAGGVALTVLGPGEVQVRALQRDWDRKLEAMRKKKGPEAQAEAAAFADRSVYNLASIVVLAEMGGRRMVLTGDARGDHVLAGLGAAGLLRNGAIHVDLLKVPHHGSDRNVTTDFFRQVTADHYVISADGQHGNPDPRMLRMLAEARGDAEYRIHLTNRVEAAEPFFAEDRRRGRRYEVVYREPAVPSVTVALA
jgi:hypothetical protein